MRRKTSWTENRLMIVLTIVVVFGGFESHAQAQSGEDIAGGLLQALIESRLEKPNRNRGQLADVQPWQPQQLKAEMRQLRTLSAAYAQETDQLAALLQTESRRDHEFRHHLPDVIAECDTHEQELLLRLASGLTPDLVYIRSMLAN